MKIYVATSFWLLFLCNYHKLLSVYCVQRYFVRRYQVEIKIKNCKHRSHLLGIYHSLSLTWSHLILTIFLWVGSPGNTHTMSLQVRLYYSQHFPYEETGAQREFRSSSGRAMIWGLNPELLTPYTCLHPLSWKHQKQGFPMSFQPRWQPELMAECRSWEKFWLWRRWYWTGLHRMGRISTSGSWVGGKYSRWRELVNKD